MNADYMIGEKKKTESQWETGIIGIGRLKELHIFHSGKCQIHKDETNHPSKWKLTNIYHHRFR